MFCRPAALALLPLAGLAPAIAHAADSTSYTAEYAVSLYGLTLARTRFTSTLSGDAFSVKGAIASAGVARIIDDTKGNTTVTGHFSGDRAKPDSFLIAYTSGKKHKKTAIEFSGDTVSRVENIPPLKKQDDRWVRLAAADLKAVADPLSLTLIKADKPNEVCSHTLKYFDGELRADIRLSYASMKPVSITGYSGDSVVCDARFVPVGGYRKGNKTIAFMQTSKITIAFAPMGTSGVYVPLNASVGTKIGTVQVSASKFSTGE